MTARDDLSRLTLERFVLGRLDASEHADVERRVSEDPDLQGRLANIQQQIADARKDLPPLDLSIFSASEAPHLEVVPAPTKTGRSPWRWARLGVAVLAAGAPSERDAPARRWREGSIGGRALIAPSSSSAHSLAGGRRALVTTREYTHS